MLSLPRRIRASAPLLRSAGWLGARLGVLLLVLFAAACPSTNSVVVRTAERPPQVDMSLGPADVFEVRVYGEAELTSTYRVSPDGSIDFPLIGRVVVKGMTTNQVAEDITARLKSYIRNPQVNVFVKELNSKKVTIYGQVQHPGTVNYVEAMTIIQAVSQAGGLTAMADRAHTRISRVKDGKAETFVVNLKEVAEGASTCYLLPGDEIFIPERLF